MKKYIIILGILVLASIHALPVYAMGHGMGGGGMTGNRGSALMGRPQGFQNRNDYNGPADQEKKQMEALDRRYDQEADILNEQSQRKERELEALLKASDPDIEKIRTLHGEIRGLRSQLAEKQRTYDLQARGTNSGIPSENRSEWSPYSPSGRHDSHVMGYGQHRGDNVGR